MTTTVNVRVSGRYRAIVRQDNLEPVTINGEEDRSFILNDHPMHTTFDITEESLSAPAATVGLHEDPSAAPRPTPEQIAADQKERAREQETLAQRDAKVKEAEAEQDRKDKAAEREKDEADKVAVRKAAAETQKAAEHTVKAAADKAKSAPTHSSSKPFGGPTRK